MSWRAFAGQWDEADRNPGRAYIDKRALTWEQARTAIQEYLSQYRTDSCADCREAGLEELAALELLDPETPYRGEIDGEDLLIVAE
jgi:hypothetical protein